MNDILIGKHESVAVEPAPHFGNRQGTLETMTKQIVRTMGSQFGRHLRKQVLRQGVELA